MNRLTVATGKKWADVEMHAPIAESRTVLHTAERYCRAELSQRLAGVDEAPEIGSVHANAVPSDFEPVMFAGQFLIDDKADIRFVLSCRRRIFLHGAAGRCVEKAQYCCPAQSVGCGVYPPGHILHLENVVIYLRCGRIGDYWKHRLPARASSQHACAKHRYRDYATENSGSCRHTDSGHRCHLFVSDSFFRRGRFATKSQKS